MSFNLLLLLSYCSTKGEVSVKGSGVTSPVSTSWDKVGLVPVTFRIRYHSSSSSRYFSNTVCWGVLSSFKYDSNFGPNSVFRRKNLSVLVSFSHCVVFVSMTFSKSFSRRFSCHFTLMSARIFLTEGLKCSTFDHSNRR